MVHYDFIAKQWHAITGSEGGALKKYVLNDLILSRIKRVAGLSILELGAGNGYFIPLLLKKFSGQIPLEIVITDHSDQILKIARKSFPVLNAKYQNLDVCNKFPFRAKKFDLILSTMVFNEIPDLGLHNALQESYRVLKDNGTLLATVLHPDFVDSLARRGKLKKQRDGRFIYQSTKGMRLPVVKRSLNRYFKLLNRSGFKFKTEDAFPSLKVLNAKPGLRKAGKIALAVIFSCQKGE